MGVDFNGLNTKSENAFLLWHVISSTIVCLLSKDEAILCAYRRITGSIADNLGPAAAAEVIISALNTPSLDG